MFGRSLERWVAIALVVGIACEGHDNCGACAVDGYRGVARGAGVIPPPASADTSARASVFFNATAGTYSYSVAVAPSGMIDSIAFYQVPPGASLPAAATAILCAGVAACAAAPSGYATLVAPATLATIQTSIRAYGTQVVFFTTTAQTPAGGAMRGTMYPAPE